jgi:hypothetical protein
MAGEGVPNNEEAELQSLIGEIETTQGENQAAADAAEESTALKQRRKEEQKLGIEAISRFLEKIDVKAEAELVLANMKESGTTDAFINIQFKHVLRLLGPKFTTEQIKGTIGYETIAAKMKGVRGNCNIAGHPDWVVTLDFRPKKK